MDTTKYMIIAKDRICTKEVRTCIYNVSTNKYDITFENGRRYSYSAGNVLLMQNPNVLDSKNYIIETPKGKHLFDIKQIYEFSNPQGTYWHIVLDAFECDYKKIEHNLFS